MVYKRNIKIFPDLLRWTNPVNCDHFTKKLCISCGILHLTEFDIHYKGEKKVKKSWQIRKWFSRIVSRMSWSSISTKLTTTIWSWWWFTDDDFDYDVQQFPSLDQVHKDDISKCFTPPRILLPVVRELPRKVWTRSFVFFTQTWKRIVLFTSNE